MLLGEHGQESKLCNVQFFCASACVRVLNVVLAVSFVSPGCAGWSGVPEVPEVPGVLGVPEVPGGFFRVLQSTTKRTPV